MTVSDFGSDLVVFAGSPRIGTVVIRSLQVGTVRVRIVADRGRLENPGGDPKSENRWTRARIRHRRRAEARQ